MKDVDNQPSTQIVTEQQHQSSSGDQSAQLPTPSEVGAVEEYQEDEGVDDDDLFFAQ